jgi:hypothetical protein
MKLLEKLQTVRIELQKAGLKKSGLNKFAGFEYYELSDLLPAINTSCELHKMTTVFNANDTCASLEIRDYETTEVVRFEIPFKMPEIKGANAVQCLGGAITYLRRYLFINAFEICENDPNDAVIGKDVVEHKTTPKPEYKPSKVDTSLDPSIYCFFGKESGTKWADMPANKQTWYLTTLKAKEMQTPEQLKAIRALESIGELPL